MLYEAVLWIAVTRSGTNIANRRNLLIIVRRPLKSGRNLADNHKETPEI